MIVPVRREKLERTCSGAPHLVTLSNSQFEFAKVQWNDAKGSLSELDIEGGPDVADQYIAAHAAAGDLVVPQDIPLAALLVPMRIAVLDPRGDEHTEDTIGGRLSVRDFMDNLRSAGVKTEGPPPYDKRAKRAFASALDRTLTRLCRPAP